MSALDAGKAYLQQVLEKLPAEQRAQAEAVFNAAEAAAAVSVLGEGVLRQQDYSRNMDQVAAEKARAQAAYESNLKWYQDNNTALQSVPTYEAEIARLQAQLEGKPAVPPATPPPAAPAVGVVTTEDLQGIISESLGLHAVIPTLIASHQVRFGEVLTEEQMIGMIQQAQQHKRSLKSQYAITFGEKIAAKEAADKAAYEEKLRQEGEARYRQANPNMPYPVRPTGTSPLDAIKNPLDPASLSPDALAREYEALVAGKV